MLRGKLTRSKRSCLRDLAVVEISTRGLNRAISLPWITGYPYRSHGSIIILTFELWIQSSNQDCSNSLVSRLHRFGRQPPYPCGATDPSKQLLVII